MSLTKRDISNTMAVGSLAEVEYGRRRFWEFAKHVKTRDENVGRVREFPKYPFLEEAQNFLLTNRLGIMLKSRQMLISYLMMLDMLWRAWKVDNRDGGTFFGAGISKREEDAIELLDRVKFMYNTLPEHFKRANPIKKQTQTYLEFENGGKIKALPASEDIGRTYTFTHILFDEFAFAPWDRKMWGALRPTIGSEGRMYAVSTPNGKFNLFYDIWADQKHYKGIARHKLHWTEHPERDDAWAEMMKASMSEDTWQREYELSFASLAGKRVYPEFKYNIHVTDFDYVPSRALTVYETWDFGYHHPAVLWAIRNKADQLMVTDEMMGTDTDTESFVDDVIEKRDALFPYCTFKVFCDVAGFQKSATPKVHEARSDVGILNKKGIHPYAKKVGVREGCDRIRRMLWPLRKDGKPWLQVHPRCQILIDGFQGGYCFEDKDVPKEEPKKDGYYEHLQDCLRYKAAHTFDGLTTAGQKSRSRRQNRRYQEYALARDEFGGY